jgi:hypothetical protein
MYTSALTESSQIFSRIDCESSNYYYEAIQVNVVETGCYSLLSNSTIDIYGYIYKDNFDPSDLTMNLLSESDQSTGNNQFELISGLQTNITYILVITTFDPNLIGLFSVLLTGPKNVNLNRISKYLYFFVKNQRGIIKQHWQCHSLIHLNVIFIKILYVLGYSSPFETPRTYWYVLKPNVWRIQIT